MPVTGRLNGGPSKGNHVKKPFSLVVALCALFQLPLLGFTEEYNGRVVGVSDGDTLTLLVEGKRQIKVRLADIDAPEGGQAYGTRTKQELSSLAFNKGDRVRVQDTDIYGRTVGRVFVGNVNVNAEMVRRGAAWVYRKYAAVGSGFGCASHAKNVALCVWAARRRLVSLSLR